MFKPWSIISITSRSWSHSCCGRRLIRFEYALVVTTATVATTLAYASTEPYAAIITVLLPPVFVLAWSGCGRRGAPESPREEDGGWAAVIGVGVFLGFSALFYTLLLAYAAFTLALMALAGRRGGQRRWDPVLRLLVIAVIAGAIALIGWAPVSDRRHPGRTRRQGDRPALPARRRRPADVPDAELHPARRAVHGRHTVAGGVRAQLHPRGSPGRRVLAVYAWSLLSMLTTLVGTTLLSFRLQPTLTRAADGRGRVRLHRGDAGDRGRGTPSSHEPAHRRRAAAVGADRRHDVQPGHPRRAAPRHRRRLHRHRRLRAARRPPATRRRAVLRRRRRQDHRRSPGGHATRRSS